MASAADARVSAPRLPIDPAYPISVLAAGPQSITILADMNHGEDHVSTMILRELDALAAQGYKHLVFEFEEDGTQEGELARRFFAPASNMQASELRANWGTFVSVNATNEAEGRRDAQNYVEILIRARELGMAVHLTGDSAEREESFRREIDAINVQIDALEQEEADFVAQNADMHEHYLEFKKRGIGYFETIAADEAFKQDLSAHMQTMRDFSQKKTELFRRLTAASQSWSDERLGEDVEAERAERILERTNGEKALVAWGWRHFDGDRDMDEFIDSGLRTRAMQNGTPFVPSRRIELYSSRQEHADIGSDLIGRDEPHLMYFVEEGELEITEHGRDIYEEALPRNAEITTDLDQA